jgi:hypothetical protein
MRRALVLGVILFGLGVLFLGLSTIPLETSTQIGYREDPGVFETLEVFLEKGERCKVEIFIEASELGSDYNITFTQVEKDYMLFRVGGQIKETVIVQRFQSQETGHYEIYWDSLDVSKIVAYSIRDLFPRSLISAASGLTLIGGIMTISVFGVSWEKILKGEKTRLFWEGLILFGLALVCLFTVTWYSWLVGYWGGLSVVPWIFGSLVFLLIGLYMMLSGVKKEEMESQITSSRLCTVVLSC